MATTAGPALRRKTSLFPLRFRDPGPRIRRWVQWAFLLLNVWIGIEFYRFVRHYETGGESAWAPRPAGVEGWLPIASLMNLKYWVVTGRIPEVHPAGMFLLLAFLGVSLLFRKSFCGWLCPVGTISEWLWRGGRRLFGRTWALPRWADLPLRSLKYILMGLFLYAIGTMSAAAIALFLQGPYGVIADVKMLNFFRYMSVTAAVVIVVLIALSAVIQNFWCRYLCPYGALLGLVSWLSPVRIRRSKDLCIDCAECARACPSQLKVDQLIQIKSPECLGCFECVAACPVEGALDMSVARRRLPAWAMAAGISVVFLGVVSGARLAGHWHTDTPSEVYFNLIPRAHEFSHP